MKKLQLIITSLIFFLNIFNLQAMEESLDKNFQSLLHKYCEDINTHGFEHDSSKEQSQLITLLNKENLFIKFEDLQIIIHNSLKIRDGLLFLEELLHAIFKDKPVVESPSSKEKLVRHKIYLYILISLDSDKYVIPREQSLNFRVHFHRIFSNFFSKFPFEENLLETLEVIAESSLHANKKISLLFKLFESFLIIKNQFLIERFIQLHPDIFNYEDAANNPVDLNFIENFIEIDPKIENKNNQDKIFSIEILLMVENYTLYDFVISKALAINDNYYLSAFHVCIYPKNNEAKLRCLQYAIEKFGHKLSPLHSLIEFNCLNNPKRTSPLPNSVNIFGHYASIAHCPELALYFIQFCLKDAKLNKNFIDIFLCHCLELIIYNDNILVFTYLEEKLKISSSTVNIIDWHRSSQLNKIYKRNLVEFIVFQEANKLLNFLLENNFFDIESFIITYYNSLVSKSNNPNLSLPPKKNYPNNLFFFFDRMNKNTVTMVLEKLDPERISKSKKLRSILNDSIKFLRSTPDKVDQDESYPELTYISILKRKLQQAESKVIKLDSDLDSIKEFIKKDTCKLLTKYNNESLTLKNKLHQQLFMAAEQGAVECFRYLHSRINDINILNKDNENPLMVAILNNRLKLIENILELNPNLDLISDENKSVFDLINEKDIKQATPLAQLFIRLKKLPFENINDQLKWAFEKGYLPFMLELMRQKNTSIENIIKNVIPIEINRDEKTAYYEGSNLFLLLLQNQHWDQLAHILSMLKNKDIILKMQHQRYSQQINDKGEIGPGKDNMNKVNILYYCIALDDLNLLVSFLNILKEFKDFQENFIKIQLEELQNNRFTIIHYLVENKKSQILEYFCQNFDFNSNIKNSKKQTPLELAQELLNTDATNEDVLKIIHLLKKEQEKREGLEQNRPMATFTQPLTLVKEPERMVNWGNHFNNKYKKLGPMAIVLTQKDEEKKAANVEKTNQESKKNKERTEKKMDYLDQSSFFPPIKKSGDGYVNIPLTPAQSAHNERIVQSLIRKEKEMSDKKKNSKRSSREIKQLDEIKFSLLQYVEKIEKAKFDFQTQCVLTGDEKLATDMLRKNHWLYMVRIFQILSYYQRFYFNVNDEILINTRNYLVHNYHAIYISTLEELFNQKKLDPLLYHLESTKNNKEIAIDIPSIINLNNFKIRPISPELKLRFIQNELAKLQNIFYALKANVIDFQQEDNFIEYLNSDFIDLNNIDQKLLNSTCVLKALESTMVIIGEYFDSNVQQLEDPFLTQEIRKYLMALRKDLRNPNCHEIIEDLGGIILFDAEVVETKKILGLLKSAMELNLLTFKTKLNYNR